MRKAFLDAGARVEVEWAHLRHIYDMGKPNGLQDTRVLINEYFDKPRKELLELFLAHVSQVSA